MRENKDKIILDLCGGTGSWSKPYRDARHIVHVITLPKYNITKVEFGTYAMDFIRQDVHYHDTLCVLYEDVYGILAAPPSSPTGEAARMHGWCLLTIFAKTLMEGFLLRRMMRNVHSLCDFTIIRMKRYTWMKCGRTPLFWEICMTTRNYWKQTLTEARYE